MPILAPAFRALRAGWWRLCAGLPLLARHKREVASLWGEAAAQKTAAVGQRPRFWLDSTQVLENYVWARFGGVDWYNYVRSRYCPQPRDKALSLCCGDGLMDRYLIWVGVCRQCEGIDISPQAVALAQHAAAAANLPTLSYRVGDIEKLTLPRQS